MIEAKGEQGRKERGVFSFSSSSSKRNFSTQIRQHRRISTFFLDPDEGQRGSNRLFLMDYRPAAAVAHI